MRQKNVYKIRKAMFQDVKSIYKLIKQHPDEVLPLSISDIIQNIDRFIVSQIEDRIVGTASWQILPEIGKVENSSIEIKSLSVATEFQHRGIGTALVEAMLERLKVYQPVQVVVLTFVPEFFQKFGFKKVPKETLMYKLYSGCINCTKYESPFTCPAIAMMYTSNANS